MSQAELFSNYQNDYLILPRSLNRSGFALEEIRRAGTIRFYIARNPKNYEQVRGYIFAKIRIKKETRLPNGIVTPRREIFPSPSKFGTDAWYYLAESYKIAMKDYWELIEKMKTSSSSPRPKKAA